MANDNQAKFAKIGMTVMLGVIGIIGTLIWLGGIGIGREEMLIETYSDKPVSGLSIGSAVNFRGVKVGEVRDISFVSSKYPEDSLSEEDMQKIYILMAINDKHLHSSAETPEEVIEYLIRKGMRATVTASGVTGLSRIELNFPQFPSSPQPISWTPDHPCVPPEPSVLDSFSDSLTLVLNRVKKMDFTTVWTNLTTIAGSIDSLASTANEMVQSQRGRIEDILSNLEEASRDLKELSISLKDNPSLLIRQSGAEALEETKR